MTFNGFVGSEDTEFHKLNEIDARGNCGVNIRLSP